MKFVVDVVALIECDLLENGKEIAAFTRNKRDPKLLSSFSNRRLNGLFSSRDVSGY